MIENRERKKNEMQHFNYPHTKPPWIGVDVI